MTPSIFVFLLIFLISLYFLFEGLTNAIDKGIKFINYDDIKRFIKRL